MFQRFVTFYAKDEKDITQDNKDTTQDEKAILGTKGTKQGHSGQKGIKGTFSALCFPWARVFHARFRARVAWQKTSPV